MQYLRKLISICIAIALLFNLIPSVSLSGGFGIEPISVVEAHEAKMGYGYYQSYKIVTNVFRDFDFGDVSCVYEWEEEIFGFTCDSTVNNECNPGPPSITMTPVDSFCISLDEIYTGG